MCSASKHTYIYSAGRILFSKWPYFVDLLYDAFIVLPFTVNIVLIL